MKNTNYFSHDYNTRFDEKIKKLIRIAWVEGYWVYWILIEDLYNNANAMRLDYEGIAYDMRVDIDVVKKVISECDLFVINEWDEPTFYSQWVVERLDKRLEKSASARASARSRWDKENANALQTDCDSNAIKESKWKERKEKEKTKTWAEAHEIESSSKLVSAIDSISEQPIKNEWADTEEKKHSVYIDWTPKEVAEEIENYIKFWNKTYNEKRIITEKLSEAYKRMRKKYSKKVFVDALMAYVEKKNWVTEKNFLLDPLRFLTRKDNWYETYL